MGDRVPSSEIPHNLPAYHLIPAEQGQPVVQPYVHSYSLRNRVPVVNLKTPRHHQMGTLALGHDTNASRNGESSSVSSRNMSSKDSSALKCACKSSTLP